MKSSFLILSLLVCVVTAQAKKYHIHPDHGRWNSINEVTPRLNSGDEVYVDDGLYNEPVVLTDGVVYILESVNAILKWDGNDLLSTLSDNGVYVNCFIHGGTIIRTNTYVPTVKISGGGKVVFDNVRILNPDQGAGLYVERADSVSWTGFMQTNTDYALWVGGTSDTMSAQVWAAGTISSNGNSGVQVANGRLFLTGGSAESMTCFGFEQSGGVAHISNTSISSYSPGGYEVGDAISYYGGYYLTLDNVIMSCLNPNAFCLSGQQNPVTVELRSDCYYNTNTGESPDITIIGPGHLIHY